MKTIYILGYNNLGADFWSKHIDFNENNRVLFFKDGTSLLQHLEHKPDLIIVDDYFCKTPPENHNFNDLIIGLSILASQTPTFFFSPIYSGKARKSMKMNHYYSCLDKSMLSFVNKEIERVTHHRIAA